MVLDDFGEQAATHGQERSSTRSSIQLYARLATVITTRFRWNEIDSPIAHAFIDPKISVTFAIEAPDYSGDSTPGTIPQNNEDIFQN